MPDKIAGRTLTPSSSDKRAFGRWKVSCAAGQDPDTGAPIRCAAYGQTRQEAAQHLFSAYKANAVRRSQMPL